MRLLDLNPSSNRCILLSCMVKCIVVFLYVAVASFSAYGEYDHHQRRITETKSLTMRLIHRNAPSSPFRKTYRSQMEAIRDSWEMDSVRLKEFAARLRSSLSRYSFSAGSPVRSGESMNEDAQILWKHAKPLTSAVIAGAFAGSGQYFVSFNIGTPARTFLLIVDTGSDLVWLKCCDRCSSSSPLFNIKKSKTFSPIPCFWPQCSLVPPPAHFSCNRHPAGRCEYDYIYADLSDSSGILAYETVILNSTSNRSTKVKHVVFGCGLKNTGKSLTGSGGVLGLGREPMSFASQLGSKVDSIFSYCFVDFFRSPSEDSYLVFGKSHTGNASFQYTPFLQNPFVPTLYYIGIEHISVNGEVLSIHPRVWRMDAEGNGGAVIDSGTTLTYFLGPAYHRILSAFRRAISYPLVRMNLPTSFDLCFNTSNVSQIELPKLVITFSGNATFEPPSTNYFVEVSNDIKCLSFQQVSSGLGFSVLGNLLQQNFLMRYDRKHEQLGFAPRDCSAG
eukprot:c168_g1_i1 orf=416-1924(+)